MTQRATRPARLTARDLMRETELVIPVGMSVGAAARVLEAAGGGVAPVVDYRGRCVGVFTAADYRRWVDRVGSDAAPAPGRHPVTGPARADEVRHHMTSRFATAMPETGVQELLHRLDEATTPFLIVLDRQARPRGIVCALDVLVSESDRAGSGTAGAVANRACGRDWMVFDEPRPQRSGHVPNWPRA